MPNPSDRPDKAYRIPTNAVPGLVELGSNFTTYIAECNPETAGEDVTPVDCGSVNEVAEKFKPKIELELKKLNNLGDNEVQEEMTNVVMHYGEQPREIMNDFKSDNLVVKMKTEDGERVLLDQQLDYIALEDLQEKLKDQKFAQLFQSNRDALIEALESEIERVKRLSESAEFDTMM